MCMCELQLSLRTEDQASDLEGLFTTFIYDPLARLPARLLRGMCIPGTGTGFYCITVLLLLPQTCTDQRKYYDNELILITLEYLH